MRVATVVTLLFTVVASTPAIAQPPAAEAWQFTVAPYFMGAAMNGTSGVAGQELTVDMTFSDILDHLQFGAMGLVVARKGQWGVGGDALWMSLGADGTSKGPGGVSGSADMNQGAFTFYGLRQLGPAADLMFGGRVNTLQAALSFSGPAQRNPEQSKTWFDPLVGLQLRTPDSGTRWHAQVYTEIGGFGAGRHSRGRCFPPLA